MSTENKTRTEPGTYRYRIRSLGYSSARYGPCEACGKPASDVHIQSAECSIPLYPDEEPGPLWAHAGTTFGHESCLLNARVETP